MSSCERPEITDPELDNPTKRRKVGNAQELQMEDSVPLENRLYVPFNLCGIIIGVNRFELCNEHNNKSLLYKLYENWLGQITNGDNHRGFKVDNDSNESILIDRDPDVFKAVAHYINSGNRYESISSMVLNNTRIEIRLQEDALYYEMIGLYIAVKYGVYRDWKRRGDFYIKNELYNSVAIQGTKRHVDINFPVLDKNDIHKVPHDPVYPNRLELKVICDSACYMLFGLQSGEVYAYQQDTKDTEKLRSRVPFSRKSVAIGVTIDVNPVNPKIEYDIIRGPLGKIYSSPSVSKVDKTEINKLRRLNKENELVREFYVGITYNPENGMVNFYYNKGLLPIGVKADYGDDLLTYYLVANGETFVMVDRSLY